MPPYLRLLSHSMFRLASALATWFATLLNPDAKNRFPLTSDISHLETLCTLLHSLKFFFFFPRLCCLSHILSFALSFHLLSPAVFLLSDLAYSWSWFGHGRDQMISAGKTALFLRIALNPAIIQLPVLQQYPSTERQGLRNLCTVCVQQ